MKISIGSINADVVQIGHEIVNGSDGTEGVEVEIRRDQDTKDDE